MKSAIALLCARERLDQVLNLVKLLLLDRLVDADNLVVDISVVVRLYSFDAKI